MSTVLIMGLPGAGKSAVAECIFRRRNYIWLSASRVLQDYGKMDASVAVRWRGYWDQGIYAPDAEVLPVLWEAYARCSLPVLLDGYPRTVFQFSDFTARGGRLDSAVLLNVDRETALRRLRIRAAQQHRSDDVTEIFHRRIQTEYDRIIALCELEAVQSVLTVVDATRPLPTVTISVLAAI